MLKLEDKIFKNLYNELGWKIEDSIKLKKSKNPVSIVRFKDNFFDKVRTKLRL